jgi:ATP-dependent DNA helicase RecG
MADLSTDVQFIKGIGPQRAKSLSKLGIATLRDLISWLPRRYEDRTEFRRSADLVPGEAACVAAMVAAPPTLSHIRKGMDLIKVRTVDETGTLDVTFFNQTGLKSNLARATYAFYGRQRAASCAAMASPWWTPGAAGGHPAASCPSTL